MIIFNLFTAILAISLVMAAISMLCEFLPQKYIERLITWMMQVR